MKGKEILENINKYWVTPIVAIVGALLGVYFNYVTSHLESETIKIQNATAQLTSDINHAEFKNNLKIKMYGEVKDAITKKDEKLHNAVLILINELLADDPDFKDQLITILLASPNVEESIRNKQEDIERKSEVFHKEEIKEVSNEIKIDIFYLEDIIEESEPRAMKVQNALEEALPNKFKIRVRRLPRSINAKSGYRISANEIRYESDEKDIANEVLAVINAKHIFELETPRMKEINPVNETPNYISVFVRNM